MFLRMVKIFKSCNTSYVAKVDWTFEYVAAFIIESLFR